MSSKVRRWAAGANLQAVGSAPVRVSGTYVSPVNRDESDDLNLASTKGINQGVSRDRLSSGETQRGERPYKDVRAGAYSVRTARAKDGSY